MTTSMVLGLAALLAPDDSVLANAMQQLVHAPEAYLEAHPGTRGRLWSSPDPVSDPAMPWLALVDALIERGHAVEIDWKIDPGDLGFSLSQLAVYESLSPELRDALAETEREETLTILHLRDAAALLEREQRVVAVMDIDSDSYIVLLLPEAQFLEASRVAGQHARQLRAMGSGLE